MMTAEDSVQLLVKSAHLQPEQLQAVVDSLQAGAARFDAMDWSEQRAFKEVYDTATRLLLVHLEAMDPATLAPEIRGLVADHPYTDEDDAERLEWIVQRTQADRPEPEPGGASEVAEAATARQEIFIMSLLAGVAAIGLRIQSMSKEDLAKTSAGLTSISAALDRAVAAKAPRPPSSARRKRS